MVSPAWLAGQMGVAANLGKRQSWSAVPAKDYYCPKCGQNTCCRLRAAWQCRALRQHPGTATDTDGGGRQRWSDPPDCPVCYFVDLEGDVFWASSVLAFFAFGGASLSNLAAVMTSFPALSLCNLPWA